MDFPSCSPRRRGYSSIGAAHPAPDGSLPPSRYRRTLGLFAVSLFLLSLLTLRSPRAALLATPDTPECKVARAESGQPAPDGRYDYIVVGGGAAGSTLARRLSDDQATSVLLLEQGFGSQASLGGTRRAGLHLDGMKNLTVYDVPAVWASVSTYLRPVPDAAPPVDDKVLGGCGVRNAMIYVRALAEDFDRWHLPGWNADMALRMYKDLEDFDGPPDLDWHGYGGGLVTTAAEVVGATSQAFLQLGEFFGLPVRQDFNKPGERSGLGRYHFNIRDGVRHSAARAFLGPVVDFDAGGAPARENLHVILGAKVGRVILEDESDGVPRAVGIEFTRHVDPLEYRRCPDLPPQPKTLPTETVWLRRTHAGDRGVFGEVVLTAGALRTPKVLMNSGIGEFGYLTELGLPRRVHSPNVGVGLQDHPAVGVFFERQGEPLDSSKPGYAGDLPAEEYERRAQASMKRHGETPLGADVGEALDAAREARGNASFGLAASTGISVGAFLNSRMITIEARAAREQRARGGEFTAVLEDMKTVDVGPDDLRASLEGTPDIQVTLFHTPKEPHTIRAATAAGVKAGSVSIITVALMNPQGRLRLWLDPHDTVGGRARVLPEIADQPGQIVRPDFSLTPIQDKDRHYHLALTREDRAALVRGVTLTRSLLMGEPMRSYLTHELQPGPGYNQVPDPNEAMIQWVDDNTYSNSHWCSSAAMGPREDSVLDSRLRVRNVRGLRVADASAIPTIPNGNVHSTVVLVAARAAEMIREDRDEDMRAAEEREAKRHRIRSGWVAGDFAPDGGGDPDAEPEP